MILDTHVLDRFKKKRLIKKQKKKRRKKNKNQSKIKEDTRKELELVKKK